jgi:hypothetical protein
MARGNIDSDQIQDAAKHGGSAQLQTSDGTGVAGNLPKFAADGSLTDSGVAAGGGSGTVTSVGLSTDAPWLTVGSSPVTGAGTITLDRTTGEPANEVLATPDGSSGVVGLRALVAADIPALAESKITNLTTDLAGKVPTTRNINTTAPLTGGGDLSADRTLAISNVTGDTGSGGEAGAVPAPGAGDAAAGKFLKADGTWEVPSGGGGSGSGFAFGGDGSDGAVDLDGTNTYAAFTSTSGSAPNKVYTLTRDVYATTLTVEASKTLITGNFRIFCKTSLTVSGTIHNNGQAGGQGGSSVGTSAGSAGSGGTASATGTFSSTSLVNPYQSAVATAGVAGKTASTGAGTAGASGNIAVGAASNAQSVSFTDGLAGTAGGAGGTSGSNAGGGVGGAGSHATGTPAFSPPREPSQALTLRQTTGTQTQATYSSGPSYGGGGSGGSGAGDGTNAGGGSGGSGGCGGGAGNIVIAAPTITVNTGGTISANGGTGGQGGNGGNGAAGNASGGGGGAGGSGGQGGLLILIYHSLSNSGTISAAGGSPGTHGTGGNKATGGTGNNGSNGSDGNAGQNGTVIEIAL